MGGWAVVALRDAVRAVLKSGQAELAADLGRLAEAIIASEFVAWRRPGSERIATRCLEAATRDDLGVLLAEIAGWAGATHVSFQVIAERSARYDTRMITTLPEDWLAHYLRRRLQGADPVLAEALESDRPFLWSRLRGGERPGPDLAPMAVGFWRDAERFGIGPSGLTMPLPGPGGERMAFSLISALPVQIFAERMHERRHDLCQLVSGYAEAFRRVAVHGPDAAPVLNDWEVTLLRGLASGDDETALKSQLAAVTDIFRLESRLLEAFRARTLAQAAAVATRLGLLDGAPLLAGDIDRVMLLSSPDEAMA